MRLLAPLLLLLTALAFLSCADPNIREPEPQPIIPGDSLR